MYIGRLIQTAGSNLYDKRPENRAKMALMNLSFTAYYKVRTFRNVFLCAYLNLIWVKTSSRLKITSDPQIQILPRGVKYLHFLRTLESSHVALNHFPKKFLQESTDHLSNI